MRSFLLFILALPLSAQQVACEPAADTLRLLETVPPLEDFSIGYEQRVGALRTLAEKHPRDFFIQRAYQDSFRKDFELADEYDRALAMYRERSADPLALYWEARLLMWHEPRRAKSVFEHLLDTNPSFAWPHLDISDWRILPGKRDDPELVSHANEFHKTCPEAFGASMVVNPDTTRRALERRNTPLELRMWPALWIAEENTGSTSKELSARLRADLQRMEAWPFRTDPELFRVYGEAARILKDPRVMSSLRVKAEHDAPDSLLAMLFVKADWNRANPAPDRNAPPSAWRKVQEEELGMIRLWLRRCPSLPQQIRIIDEWNAKAVWGEPVSLSSEDLALIDQALRMREMSPDASGSFPPLEASIARIYVAAKVRLIRVPDLLGSAMLKIRKQTKYELSQELEPAEMRGNRNDWLTATGQQVEMIRVDYLLAGNRPADARTLIEQALWKLNADAEPSSRARLDRAIWLRRLGDVDSQEGLVKDALTHYQASMADLNKRSLATPEMQRTWSAVKRYYLAHGGSEEKWPDWATNGRKDLPLPERKPLAFVIAVPEFSVKDVAGRTWQLGDLKGKTTFVNFWATWCGPCRGEHRAIEELYRRIKDRDDIQVLTIAIDDGLASVTDYIKEYAYNFPVVHSPELAGKIFPYTGLPTNFVVNAKGMRTSLYGFGADSASVDQVIQDLTPGAIAHGPRP